MLSFFFPVLIFEQLGWARWRCCCDTDNVKIKLTVNAQPRLLPVGPLRFVFEELHLVWDCVHRWGGDSCSRLISCFILGNIFIWIPLRVVWLVIVVSVQFWNDVLDHFKRIFILRVQLLTFLWLPTTIIADVHSCQQKSIGLKFSKSQTGSDVRYSCPHNSSRFTFPIFAHSCRFSVLHSLQSITPRMY